MVLVPKTPPSHLSHSQAEVMRSCETKWWLKYVAQVPEPEKDPNTGAGLGSAKHKVLERYYKGQLEWSALQQDPVIKTGLVHLFTRSPGVHSEFSIDGLLPLGHLTWKGAIDLLSSSRHSGVTAVDFKFLGDPERYGATSADLVDPSNSYGRQMLTYAAAVHKAMPAAKTVDVAHIQFCTKQPKTARGTPKPARFAGNTVDPKRAYELWEEFTTPVVEQIKRAGQFKTIDQTEPNTEHCSAFGGCPFKAVCPFYAQASASNWGVAAGVPSSSRPDVKPVYTPGHAPGEDKDEDVAFIDEMDSQSSTPTPSGTETTPSVQGQVVLFFNAFQVGAKMKSLAQYVEQVEVVALEGAAGDIRLSKAGEFGKWKAKLEAAVSTVGLPESGRYAVGNGEKEQVVAEALAALPGVGVVRGGRS